MTDSSEIGRYGTLRLLKRHEPETTVAFFPIDDEVVTFGRNKGCSVRLYYDCVSELHCTVQFTEERKAFLLVQGTNGLLVDGCQVNPSVAPGAGPTTVPLTNGSEIEIYKKRFKFEYPPKQIRAALLATPHNVKSRSSLRMSMIGSAQVYTPRTSPDPHTPRKGNIGDHVHWQALRSPVTVACQDGSTQEETLIEGNGEDAVVVEEERDIIIIEQVEKKFPEQPDFLSSNPRPNRSRSVAFSLPTATPPPTYVPVPQTASAPQNPLQTPPNRRRSAPSLHRAVVLRSAQRALQRERQKREEAQEEDEVEAVVSPERELGPSALVSNKEGEDDDTGDLDGEEEHEPHSPVMPSNANSLPLARRMSVFRTSLDVMRKAIPLPFGWKAPEEISLPDDEGDGGEYDEEEKGDRDQERNDDECPDEGEHDCNRSVAEYVYTPVRRNLGPFMTPQIQAAQRVPVDTKPRASVGGDRSVYNTVGGAQRVRVVPAWKVKDIVLPEPEISNLVTERQRVRKEHISDEERQEIMARRKSAFHTPSRLPMPGPRSSAFPPPLGTDIYTPGEDAEEDAETMLKKMKQKVANVRRKSEARRMRPSIRGPQQAEAFSLLAAGAERNDRITEETLSQMKGAELDDDDLAEPLPDARASDPDTRDRDELNILDKFSDEKCPQRAPRTVARRTSVSLTPRFDGVREMFRQPHAEPKTPSFTGIRKMFHERSEMPPKTPSLHGVREMFSQPVPPGVPPTPHMDLGDMFDEADKGLGRPIDPIREPQSIDAGNGRTPTSRAHGARAPKSEQQNPASPDPAPKTSTRTRQAAASTGKRSVKKKGVSAIGDEHASGEEEIKNESEDVEAKPPVADRRSTKRFTKNAKAATPSEAAPAGEGSGRGTSRSTRRVVASTFRDTSEGIVEHQTARTRGAAHTYSDDEEATDSERKTKGSGRSKRADKNQQVSESNNEAAQEAARVAVNAKSGFDRGNIAGSSDNEGALPPTKVRRGRVVKTPQEQDECAEVDDAPTTTRTTRRGRAKVSPAVEPTPRHITARRGAKNKVVEVVDEDDEEVLRMDGHLSESEDATPAPTRGKVARKGTTRKTPASKDSLSEEKENSGDQEPKSSGKTPVVRGRRTAVETVDAPARRTRSRKC